MAPPGDWGYGDCTGYAEKGVLSVVVDTGVAKTPTGGAWLGLRALSRLVVNRLWGWTACCLREAAEGVEFRRPVGDCA